MHRAVQSIVSLCYKSELIELSFRIAVNHGQARQRTMRGRANLRRAEKNHDGW